MKRVTLLVGGSIAAYKAAELTRELGRAGFFVRVAMSKSACEFITPLTLQTLSGQSVATDMFDLTQESEIGHISLADGADLVLVAPATANIIAKAAQGLADDLISTVLLASKCPVVFAPAMNVNMWQNELTQANVEKLRQLGHEVIAPEEGDLACGWVGEGRLAEISHIVDRVRGSLTANLPLANVRAIVTAGPTREYIDSIRYMSNRSSGKMGYAIAKELAHAGADVTLISGPVSIDAPMDLIRVDSAAEMHDAVMHHSYQKSEHELQLIFMVSAVADYRPEKTLGKKLKSDKTKEFELQLVPNVDILKKLGAERANIEDASGQPLLLVGFAAESEGLLEAAREKLTNKGADMIVANLIEESFELDESRVLILDRLGGEQSLGPASKVCLAREIIEIAGKFLDERVAISAKG